MFCCKVWYKMIPLGIMYAFTLRLNPKLNKSFDKLCVARGFSKTGLIQALIRDFVEKHSSQPKATKPEMFKGLVGMVRLGGDAVKDSEDLFE